MESIIFICVVHLIRFVYFSERDQFNVEDNFNEIKNGCIPQKQFLSSIKIHEPFKNVLTYYNDTPGFHRYGEDLQDILEQPIEVLDNKDFRSNFKPITPEYCPMGIGYTLYEN